MPRSRSRYFKEKSIKKYLFRVSEWYYPLNMIQRESWNLYDLQVKLFVIGKQRTDKKELNWNISMKQKESACKYIRSLHRVSKPFIIVPRKSVDV